ncbi:MAG: hypothetical protein LBS22_03675 [Puniceicoccales bacterium]|nr:hypothetical protein [Puniceicoccales bacterium]
MRIVTPLAPVGSPKASNPSGIGTRISGNARGEILTEEKCESADLNKRRIASSVLTRQVIAKICSFADGVSLVLDANGFEITKNVLDALSNAVRFLLPKSDHPLWKHIYGVEKKDDGEKIDLVFKRLIVALSSTCKVILKLVPQLTRLQAPLKLLPHVSLILDIIELGLNYKNFTKDGLTAKNVSKIAAALCYHAVSCATFVVAGGSGVILPTVLAISLAVGFSLLVEEGMKDTALIMQPIDKLWLNKWFVKKVYSFYEFTCLDQNSFQHQADWGRMICLSVIGLNLCRSAASAVVKLIRDSQEIPETDTTKVTKATEATQQRGKKTKRAFENWVNRIQTRTNGNGEAR